MYVILSLLTVMILYIESFKSDFEEENIKKVEETTLAITGIVIILTVILSFM